MSLTLFFDVAPVEGQPAKPYVVCSSACHSSWFYFISFFPPATVAEFNIQVDPEAAKIVFDSGLVTMIPLEVTHTALVTDAIQARIAARNSRFASLITHLLLFFAKTYKDVFKFDHPVRLACKRRVNGASSIDENL